jgi:hypothetical protein
LKPKLDKLKRIERTQRRLHDLSQWKLTTLTRERDDLVQTHEAMLAAISEGLLSFGGAAAAGSRRIRALEVELNLARIVHATQAKRTLEHGARSRLADRVVEAAAARHRAESEQRGLEELIAWTVRAAASGPRKA